VILGGVHHIEGGEVDATDGAAPATDAAMRLRVEEPEIIGVDAEPRIYRCQKGGLKPSLLFVLRRAVAVCLPEAALRPISTGRRYPSGDHNATSRCFNVPPVVIATVRRAPARSNALRMWVFNRGAGQPNSPDFCVHSGAL